MSPVRDRLDPADVERMFDRIAGPYDLMNRLMTAGLDRRWRAIAARESGVGRGATVLDACCGTGDLALELARTVGRVGEVTGLDFSAEMLARAARKPAGEDAATVKWVRGDATAMPFEDDSFAAATIAFGLRNLPDPEAGLRELARVVRPGGRVVCLEITRPDHGALKGFYSLWFDRGIPALGRVLDRGGAYSYLPASVRRFPGPEQLGEAFHRAGMTGVRYRLLAGGIVALHVGEVVA
jgi:demethylmenaquinone methyltransferase/2-methoxy-6-polyprenyl-1,4-benzoquinol methylase